MRGRSLARTRNALAAPLANRENLFAWLEGRIEHARGRRERHERRRHERGFGGPGPGDFEGGFAERGFGHGRSRLFDSGDVKLVVLKLLSEQPSYGYQLIKTMEQRPSGGYTPSVGVIYPTLTMPEDEGLTAASAENGKKVYAATAEGAEYLAANQRRVDELLERLAEAGKGFERGRSPVSRRPTPAPHLGKSGGRSRPSSPSPASW